MSYMQCIASMRCIDVEKNVIYIYDAINTYYIYIYIEIHIYIYMYEVLSTNIGTLGKYEQRRL